MIWELRILTVYVLSCGAEHEGRVTGRREEEKRWREVRAQKKKKKEILL